MRKTYLLSFLFVLLGSVVAWAQTTVSGTVTDSDGEPLIGVNIIVAGTTSGTVTDIDGAYSLEVSADAELQFSYTGFVSQTIPVEGRSMIDVVLQAGVALDEVVVTALGISREKKSITYSAQNVSTEELAQAREMNVVNSLSGKVAGISVAQSGAGVGGASRVILRGNRSIAGNSQPLYVVDGVPIIGSNLANVNPDDIASINVLKGPNAAALYGNRASNGAIIITTKSGQAGVTNVTVSSTYTAAAPIILTNYQNEYAQGNAGQYNGASEDSWGPRISGQTVDHWSNNPDFPVQSYQLQAQPDNVSDFFQTGYNWATNLAISGGTERTQTYFSYTYTDAEGVVPNNKLQRHNLVARVTNKIHDKITLDAKINYIREDVNNSLAQGEGFANPIRHALRLPRTIRTEDVSQFEFIGANGPRQHYWNPGSNGGANPYWTINRNLNQRDVDRVIGFVSLRYDITDNLAVQVRSALDRINRQNEDRNYNNSYIIADNGTFNLTRNDAWEWNNDVLVSYNRQVNEDWSFSLNLGANSRQERGSSLTGFIDRGQGFIVPNFFTLSNTNDAFTSNNFGSPRDVNSVYGFANIGFKDAIFLDLTARNDWSSTLPAANRSFFYPSFGLNVVLSDLVTLPEFFTFVKLRGSWAEVGNDTDPFRTLRTASVTAGGNNGFLTISGTIPNENLLPEETQSTEIGADLRFLRNRIGLDLTYYKSNTKNQLFSVALPIGSGASSFFTNGGDVENEGIEAILTVTPVRTNDFNWDIGFNFAANNSTVVQINDQRPRIQVASDFLRAFFIEQGEPWGNVYSRGFVRDDQGRIIVGSNGLPQITPGRTVLAANFQPDWLGGISNSLSYKNINFSFLIDIRQGGSVTSMTNAIVYGGGHTEETVPGRDGFVFGEGEYAKWGEAVLEDGTPNNLTTTSEEFWNLVGGRNAPAGEIFAVDASNVRLRELVLGYRFPIESEYVKSLRVSLVGRNLFFLSNSAGDIDPEILVGTGKAAEGFNSFAPPTQRTFGVNLIADF